MTEKRYLLKYLPYECSNGEMIETDPYYVDTKQEYVDTDDFRIEGMLTMSDKQILELLNENEQLKQELFEVKKDYFIETADISDKIYLDNMIEELRREMIIEDGGRLI